DWPLPRLETSGALAEWLGVSVEELEWLADVKGLLRGSRQSPMHHYHYRILRKRSGGVRLIEAPQMRLKTIQRTILSGILNQIPAYYSAAHGFVKGRSVRTFAEPHVGKQAVVRIDLKDFFPTIGYSRVQALFRTMGYPDAVASAFAGLCTNATPRAVFVGVATNASELEQLTNARQLYSRPHLPQGAPTSPLIANLCAYRLDCRLTGLADWAGAAYTRYADDIAISGDESFARKAARYAAQASAIAMDEGWLVQHHKTRVMRAGVRQELAGIVVNERLNITRDSFDQLKATLNNCVRLGAAGQNRDGHPDFRAYLRGRVGWVTSVNPERGKRLQDIFERIRWD
ncbi:MAG: reverse transcriptase family protein, partial [Gemmatimonadaceae bacterium]